MKLINNYLNKYSIFIFAIVTFIICFLRTPFWDETHAFEIARLNLFEIFQISSIEGHTFLWYFILKPFSNLNLYPYSMFFINWLFSVLAIFILWKKAPFKPYIKALITFSAPFVLYFAPVARCYSIGILFLFLICAYYPLRFKKPYAFTFLIVICANTSLMAAIGCFWIGLIYFFELIEKYKSNKINKKTFIKIFLIFLLCAFILFAQFIFVQTPNTGGRADFIKRFINFVILPYGSNIFQFLLHLVSSLLFYIIPFYLFKKSKTAFVFALGTYLTLTFIFIFMHQGSYWNHYFYYIYLIILFWIFNRQIKSKIVLQLFNLIIFFALFPFALHDNGKMEYIYSSKSKEISNFISSNETLKKSKLYTLEWWSDISPASDIYLAKKGIDIYDVKNRKRTSYESLKDIFKLKDYLIDFDEFYKNTPKDFYILSAGSLFNQKFKNMYVILLNNGSYIFKTKKANYKLKKVQYKKDLNLTIYQVVKL